MPQIVEVDGVGEVEFDDGMSLDDIKVAIERDILPRFQQLTQPSGDGVRRAVPVPDDWSARIAAQEAALADQPGISDDFVNTGRAFQRGMQGARQTFFGAGVVNTLTALSEYDQAAKELADFDALVASNPQLQNAPSTASQRNRLAGRLAQLEGEASFRSETLPSNIQQIREGQAEMNRIPIAGAMREFHQGDWVKALATNPVEVIVGITAESLPQMAPALVAGAVGGPGSAAMVGASSLGVEYANTAIASLQEQGIDLTDPQTYQNATPEALQSAKDKATQRGVPIGVMDAITAGLAGRILRPALGRGTGMTLLGVSGESAMQMAGGAAGEAGAQLVSEGEINDPKAVASEAIGELASAPGETMSGLRRSGEVRKARAVERVVRGIQTARQNASEQVPVTTAGDPDVELLSRAAAEATPAPPDPVRQASAQLLGQDPAELRQQEAVIEGRPVTEPTIDELESVQQQQREWLEQNYPEEVSGVEAQETPATTEEVAVASEVIAPEGLTSIEPDTYERLADQPVQEGFVAFQDQETFDVFQVPQNATPEQIEAARQQARQEGEQLARQYEFEEQRRIRQEEYERGQREVQELQSITRRGQQQQPATPQPEFRNLWDNPDNLKRILDQQEQNLRRAQSGTLRDPSGQPVTPQQLERGVQALRDRYQELTGKQQAAKTAAKGMKRGKRGEQGSTTIPQAVIEFAEAIYREGVQFKDWSRQMLRSLGQNIRPFLQDIWNSITRAVNALSPSQRARVETRMQRRDFSEGGAVGSAGGSTAVPPTTPPTPPFQPAPEPATPADNRPRRQVFGRKEGERYNPVRIAEIQERVRREIFNGNHKVTKAQTTRAKNLAYAWASDSRAVMAEMAKTDPNAPTVAKTELFRYATEMAAQGDPSLQRFLLANDSQMGEITMGLVGSASDAGLTLRLRRLMDHPLWKAVQEVSQQAEKEAAKIIGDPKADPEIQKLKDRLAELNLTPEQVLDALNNINDAGGQNLQDILNKLVGAEGAKKRRQQRRSAKKTPEEEQQDRDTEQAQKEADAAQSEADNLAERTASQILNRFEQSQTEWLQPDAEINAVRAIINDELKGQFPLPDEKSKWGAYINQLRDRLIAVGVKEETATNLAQEVFNRVRADRASRTAKYRAAEQARIERARKREEERAIRRQEIEDARATKVADGILDGFEKSQTEWIAPERSQNPIRELVKNELKGSHPLPSEDSKWSQFINPLAGRLRELGVRDPSATRLAQEVYNQLRAYRASQEYKARQAQQRRDERAEALRQEREAKAALREARKPTVTAQSILDGFQKSQTEWIRPETKNEIRELIRNEITGSSPLPDPDKKWSQFINPLASRLVDLGVDRTVATSLALEAYNQITTLRASRTWKAAEAARKKAERLSELKAKRDAARAARAGNHPTETALSILDRFEQSQTEWVRPDTPRNQIRELINNELRGQAPLPDPNNAWGYIRGLSDRLVQLGVRRQEALRLAQATYDQLIARRSAARQKAMQDAFDNGNVRPIIDAILETPMADRTGDWIKRTTEQFFEEAGLPPDLVQAATRVFSREIEAKFQQAADRALQEFVQQSTPWSRKLNSPKKAERTRAQRDLEKIRKAVRVQATDPSRTMTAELAKMNGWRGFSDADHKRMAEIDHRLSAPDLLPTEQVKLQNELFNIVRKAKLPATAMDALAESYNASALSSLGTIGVNLYGPVGEVMGQYMTFNAAAMLPGGGGIDQIIYNTEQLVKSIATMPRNMRYSATNDVYMLNENEVMMRGNALLGLLERAKADWNSGNAVRMAKALPKIMYGSMDFVRRAFNVLDDTNFRAMEQYYRALYGSQAMRRMGHGTEQIRALAAAAQSVYQHGYQSGVAMGMSQQEASMRGRDMVREAYLHELGQLTDTQEALDVEQAAKQDALLALGRNDGQLNEGFLSELTGLNRWHGYISELRSTGNWFQKIWATIYYGFVKTPFQLARYGLNYTTYGTIRYGLHQYRKYRNLPSYWQQSIGTDAQARQRLIQSIGGQLAMALMAQFVTGSNDDDRRNGIKIVITGNGPGYEDPAFRDAWLKEHKPAAIEFYAGGKRRAVIQYGRGPLEGLAWVFSMLGAVDDYRLKHGQKTAMEREDQLNAGIEVAVSYITSGLQRGALAGGRNSFQSFLKNPSGSTAGVAGSVGYAAAPLLPAAGLIRSIENILMSPRDRSSGYAALLASTPVTAPFGQPQLNFLGDPVRDVTAHGRSLNSGLPVLLQTAEVDPVYRLIGDKMVAPTTLRRSDMERALQTRFTEEQWYAITSLYGGTLKELIMDNFDTLYDMDSTEASKLMNQLSKEAKDRTLSEFE